MPIDTHLDTLLYPLRAGSIGSRREVLCIGATEALPGETMGNANVTYIQGFRADYLALQSAGCTVEPELPSQRLFDAALIRLGRHRGQNEAWLSDAADLVRDGGLVIAAGGKTDGASSLRKRLAGNDVEQEYAVLNHGVVFWFSVGEQRERILTAFDQTETVPIEGRYLTRPGMFSHGRVDAGSKLLSEHIGVGEAQHVADFCAGWGYLADQVLQKSDGVAELHLYEADFASLEAARNNLGAVSACKPMFFWRDLLREPLDHKDYDLVVMNPPFHQGRRAEPDIGQRMIAVASDALVKRGRLLMVANRHLPYEAVLKRNFALVDVLADADGFKVFEAQK